MADTQSMGDLFLALETAMAALVKAQAVESQAYTDRASAITLVNNIQKEIDARLHEIRTASPPDSNWSGQRKASPEK